MKFITVHTFLGQKKSKIIIPLICTRGKESSF